MRHIIISDTHSPQCIDKAYEKSKKLVEKHPDIDAIVINGDILGIFSMDKSNIHKEKGISEEEISEYLRLAAPKFYSKFRGKRKLDQSLIADYVYERYEWCFSVIKKFSKIKNTIFNMGNHESPTQFLVLQELGFLTKQEVKEDVVDQNFIDQVFNAFEQNLFNLEKLGKFKYIRHSHHIVNGTMILGIPGENHSTVGADRESRIQEKKTKELVEKAKEDLDKIHSLIIYNHTQGNYDRKTGIFSPASPSLINFMKNLPDNIKQKVFVQSHNHWSHTQFIKKDDFNFIMNNAGLHGGIFNLISFDTININCYDVDPENEEMISLKFCDKLTQAYDDNELITMNYPNVEIILARKGVSKNSKNNEIIEALSKDQIIELKKKIFGLN
jgi:hypothetical protein